MELLTLTDEWLRRATPLLVGVLITLLGIAGITVVTGPARAGDADALAPATPSRTESEPAKKGPAATGVVPTPLASAGSERLLRVAESGGWVRNLRLGMTRIQVEELLGEQLVSLQEASPGSRRFEVVAPRAGLRISGKHQTVDTIAITNTGDGGRYRTSKGLRLGDRSSSIVRKYTWAHKICGREWYVRQGRYTLRFTAQRRITAITLSSRRAPTYVDCT